MTRDSKLCFVNRLIDLLASPSPVSFANHVRRDMGSEIARRCNADGFLINGHVPQTAEHVLEVLEMLKDAPDKIKFTHT